MIRSAWCSACSTERQDVRELIFEEDYVLCTFCGAISVWVQDGNTPFYSLERIA